MSWARRIGGPALRLLAGVCLLLGATGAQAQPEGSSLPLGEAFALEFRDHVVRIRALGPSGARQDGFGFVVGESASGVYVVTANHVVRGTGPGETAERVMLTWFRRSGEEFPATLLSTSDERRDVAVLRVDLPGGMALRPELMLRSSGRLGRSTPVWYVGRGREWYVPTQPGAVNRIDLDDQISIDGLNVQVGTSGAPLITDDGVAGMIIEDFIGGVVKATDIGFIERAFAAWTHPWGLQDDVGPSPAVSGTAAGAVERDGLTPSDGLRPTKGGTTKLLGSAGQAPLLPAHPEPVESGSASAGPDPEAVRRGLAAFAPRAPDAGTPAGGALTLSTLDVRRNGPEELEVIARVELEGIDLGQVTAWVTPGESEGTVATGVEPAGGVWAFDLDECDVRLAHRDAHLVWDEALASFSGVQVEFGVSTVSCPGVEIALLGAALDLAFEARDGDRWDGRMEIAVEGLEVRICDDLPDVCEATRGAGLSWPWQEPLRLAGGQLLLSLDGTDLAKRMAAFEAEPPDSWPRRAAFAAALLDPVAAVAEVLDAALVADYLGTVAASLSMQGVAYSMDGTVLNIGMGEAELETGWPARFAYGLSGATLVAPGRPAAASSSGRVEVELAGRLDPATFLGGGLRAFADAAPFEITASMVSEFGRVEGSGTLEVDLVAGPSLVAAEGTLTTGDPVAFVNETLLSTIAAQPNDPAALQEAVAEVLAAQGWLPIQPSHEREYTIRYDPLAQSVTVEGQELFSLILRLDEACLRHGC